MATRFADHLLAGDHASRPAANAVPVGTLYACTDHDKIYQSDGASWSDWLDATGSTAVAAHEADAADAHDASAISFSPTGTIAATDVQAAIAEVAVEAGGGGGTPVDGWVDDTAETWTYASATTFTVPGDQTAKLDVGARIKLTQTTVKYFVVVASSHAAGTTTVTITGGTDYSLANAAITANFHSYMANPQGWPDWFNYTPTSSAGFSSALTVTYARFKVVGRMCFVEFNVSGTSNTTNSFLFSMPIVGRTGAGGGVTTVRAVNNGAVGATPGGIFSNNSGAGSHTEFSVSRDFSGTAWTASGTKGALGSVAYAI